MYRFLCISLRNRFPKSDAYYKEKDIVLNACINIGMRCPIGVMPGDIEFFGIPQLLNVNEFDTRRLLQYAFDIYPWSMPSFESYFAIVRQNFAEHSCQIREKVDSKCTRTLEDLNRQFHL